MDIRDVVVFSVSLPAFADKKTSVCRAFVALEADFLFLVGLVPTH